MAELKDLKNKDLYALFEIKENATSKEIKKAYRKKALKLHPDKNPDNPKAAALFHELSEALKILTDVGARAAYDHVKKAKQAAAARTAKLDDKRKKVKLDLEARERAAEMGQQDSRKAERNLQHEIERLREEGSRILQEEQQAMKKLLREEAEERKNNHAAEPARLKVRWKATDEDSVVYTKEKLLEIFSKHGDVVDIIVSSKKKKGSAIVEMKTPKGAESAHDSEIGFPENPLTLSWLSGKPVSHTAYAQLFSQKLGLWNESPHLGSMSQVRIKTSEPANHDDDFEEQVFRKMRAMQEKKRQEQNVCDKT